MEEKKTTRKSKSIQSQAVDAVVISNDPVNAQPTAQEPIDGTTALSVAGGNSFDYETRLATLSEADRSKYMAISAKIKLDDPTTIQSFGSELSQTVAQNGSVLLNSVRSDNSSEVVELTNDLLAELNMIDLDELTPSTWKRIARKLPIVRHLVKSVENVMIKYDTISANVEAISKKISTAKVVAMRDNSTLQTIFNNNVHYILQIRELIMAAKLKEQELRAELERMQSDPSTELYQIQDMQNFINSLGKRIADMQTTEYVMQQNLYQIRATQNNNISIADKSENIVNHVIPIWKNQLAISIIMNNQKASIDAQAKITETTNEILKKNASALKINAINVAKANEEQVISLDTLQKTTNDLIETVKEVKAIHDQGEANRKAIEKSLHDYTEQLTNAVNDMMN